MIGYFWVWNGFQYVLLFSNGYQWFPVQLVQIVPQQVLPARLSDADVDRVASAVAKKLKSNKR